MTQNQTILIAEDEPELLDIIKFRLELEGYTVLTAANGEEALEMAKEHKPDLCVLDWMMPKKTGVEVLQELRSDVEVTTKVVLLTAKTQEKDLKLGLGMGADDYIIKPFNQSDLTACVKRHLT